MGFKRENYTPQGLCACIYILLVTNAYTVFGQSHCPIRVDFEPIEESQSRSANNIEEVKFPFFQQWENLQELRISDDNKAIVSLPGGKRSTLFKGKNLGFNIPNGAQINGIELIIEGHSHGEGHVEGQMVRLLNDEGTAIGSNKAKNALPIDKDWPNNSNETDFIWRYGSSNDAWGIKLSEDLINSKEFGYALQVRNKLNVPIDVSIDHIQLVVYYTPLYEICSNHACVPFYVDDSEDPLITYEWYLPQGFELISDSEEDYAINIGPSYANFGQYEICVESFYDQVSQGECCRRFNYSNCEPAQISGQVFYDKNNDSINNSGDEAIEDIMINLYSSQSIFVASTFTDDRGEYSFLNLLPGQYYIEVIDNVDSLLFATPNVGSDSQDSDVTGAFGEGTTDLISANAGDALIDVDAGFILALTIGNFVWEDLNGDGIQQLEEPGIEGVSVMLTNSSNTIITTKTDADGHYSFAGLSAGEYLVEFPELDNLVATVPDIADADNDSDYLPNSPIFLSFSEGGIIDSIDAGYFHPSSVGDFVWEDLNSDGLQDEAEPGIIGAILNLINVNDEIIQSTTSDSTGFYQFDNITPGTYLIEIQTDVQYYPTEFNVGGGASSDIDSDVVVQDDKFTSQPFDLISNSKDLSLDFGFIEQPATIGGFTFLDKNNSGQYDSDELFISQINVYLYNSNNEKVDSTQSDEGGFYLFENIAAGFYYLVFDLRQEDLFTSADIGDDLSDSDVTSSIIFGSTDLFNLSPDEENYSLSVGYQKKPKVGDFVWLDENGNGIQDLGEMGINDVLIELYNDQNQVVQSVLTGPNPESFSPGYYLFQNIDPGDYYIKIPVNELYDFAIIDESQPGNNSTINNENGIGTSYTFNLIGNQTKLSIDGGYAFKKGNIEGEVWVDDNEDGIQAPDDILKPGVMVSLFTENGTLAFFRTTNENGQYFFTGLEAGNYFVLFTIEDQYRFTSPFSGTDISLNSDVNGENLVGSTTILSVVDGVTREHIDAGLIDGAIDINGITWIDADGNGIQESNENPLPNVQVNLYNLSDSLLATTISDANGNYKFENNLAAEYYLVFTPEDSSYINTIANQGNDDNIDDDVTSFFTSGSTDTIEVEFFQNEKSINAGYFQYSKIGDQVFIDLNENAINDNEAGLNGVFVNLYNDSGIVIASDTTTQGGGLDSGYYLLENIPPGLYTIQFTRPLFYQFVSADQGGNDSVDSDVIDISNNTGTTNSIEVLSGSSNLTIDAGVFYQIPTESSISGIVWDDLNTNGIRENNEIGVQSINIILENQIGEVISMTQSDIDGLYKFDNLPEGFYILSIGSLNDRVATFPNVGADDAIDSDFIESSFDLETEAFFLATFEDITGIDLGLVNKLTIGDFVWEDANNNGVQDAGELGIEEIEITVTSENGSISKSTMSNADGAYEFIDLPAGFYKICANLPSGFNFAKPNNGVDLLDSDVDSTGCTAFLDFTIGGIINHVDIGLTKNGSIEGIAFVDLNGNGVNNMNDPGLDGVIVNLHNTSGDLLEATMTITKDDIPGIFEFKNLKATDYYLVFEFPEEYIITNPNVGDDMSDSDITGLFEEGSTEIFAVPSGSNVTSLAGGAYLPASIGDEVWLDENEDGIRDEDEVGVPNILVIINRSFGIPIDSTMTDESGIYQFENLKQGLYFIQFVIPQEFAITLADQGNDDNVDSDSDNTGKTPLISLAHGADLESIDCGIYGSTPSLRSTVWNDINADGIRQTQEARIPGIKILLADHLNNVIDSTQSNALGLYAFQEIPVGQYKIIVDLSDTDYLITAMNVEDDDYVDSDIKQSGESEIFECHVLDDKLSVPNIDIGLYEIGGISSIVWEDINADGTYNINESPFENMEVSLYSKDAQLIRKITSTSQLENAVFDNIYPGEYFMTYKVKEGYVSSPKGLEASTDNNSDVSEFEGIFVTPLFQVLANEIVSNIDAGFYKGASVVSNVWYDSNANGIQDDNGISPTGIYATLFDISGISKGTKGLNQEGVVKFTGIQKGEYYIKYYSTGSIYFTKNVAGHEINNDVDHSFGLGTTPLFKFDPYETYTHIDAGILPPKIHETKKLALDDQRENEMRNSAIQNQDDLYFEIHPNPAANYLKIKTDISQPEGIITIRNNQNQLVFTEKVRNLDSVNLSEFHPGIYYVKYELNGKSITKKILKIQ